ncbi:hypothetical protein BDZ97DRAFT_1922470 [Flammula alnicola]|nr:hypothetical protein BDZ97DRAFT_1922470 [Flammula alnicola]
MNPTNGRRDSGVARALASDINYYPYSTSPSGPPDSYAYLNTYSATSATEEFEALLAPSGEKSVFAHGRRSSEAEWNALQNRRLSLASSNMFAARRSLVRTERKDSFASFAEFDSFEGNAMDTIVEDDMDSEDDNASTYSSYTAQSDRMALHDNPSQETVRYKPSSESQDRAPSVPPFVSISAPVGRDASSSRSASYKREPISHGRGYSVPPSASMYIPNPEDVYATATRCVTRSMLKPRFENAVSNVAPASPSAKKGRAKANASAVSKKEESVHGTPKARKR